MINLSRCKMDSKNLFFDKNITYHHQLYDILGLKNSFCPEIYDLPQSDEKRFTNLHI